MSEETIDLFIQHAIQKAKEKDNFWKNVESEAARLEVTCDYYLAEFV